MLSIDIDRITPNLPGKWTGHIAEDLVHWVTTVTLTQRLDDTVRGATIALRNDSPHLFVEAYLKGAFTGIFSPWLRPDPNPMPRFVPIPALKRWLP